jgi:hypothetical protein
MKQKQIDFLAIFSIIELLSRFTSDGSQLWSQEVMYSISHQIDGPISVHMPKRPISFLYFKEILT